MSWRDDLVEKFIRCDCGNEVLRLCFWKSDEDIDNGLDLSMFRQWNPCISWYEKARWILEILRHGTPFTDEIVLEDDQVREIIEFCENYLLLRDKKEL